MNIYVTGASGFIGSSFLKNNKNSKNTIFPISRSPKKYGKNFLSMDSVKYGDLLIILGQNNNINSVNSNSTLFQKELLSLEEIKKKNLKK